MYSGRSSEDVGEDYDFGRKWPILFIAVCLITLGALLLPQELTIGAERVGDKILVS